jgi:hypothetical protein
MPYAGYPLLTESDIFVFKYEAPASNTVLNSYNGNIETGIRMWVADTGSNDWNVYRLYDTTMVAEATTFENGKYEVTVDDS